MKNSLDSDFPLTRKYVYLNSAAVGACPGSTIKVVEDYIKDRCAWLKGEDEWEESIDKWMERIEGSKKIFAKIIGAKDSEVAFIPNTTTGINTVFSMLPLKPKENIVTTDMSYPMGAIVCLKQRERGVETRFVKNVNGEVRTEDFEDAIDDKTVAVMVDQAGWHNGFLHDLKAISQVAHEHGALLVVDAVQSAGGLKIDVKREGIDFLATSTYKWLLGGPYTQSAGFLYIDEEYIDAFQPTFVGNQTIEEDKLRTNT
ncbi:MAG: aminotransferase class V-fold PLP-dependent enzyme [Candidatus Bathyarchaeia archaeon]